MRSFISIILILASCSFLYAQEKDTVAFNQQVENIEEIHDEELLKLMLQSFLYTKDLKNAYKVATYAVKLFSDSEYWLKMAGDIALWLNRYKEAIHFYKKLYNITKDESLKEKILSISLQIYDYKTAVDILEEKVINGDLSKVKDYLYTITVLGEFDRGYETLKKVFSKHKDISLLRPLARLAKDTGNIDESIKYYEQLLETDLSKEEDFLELAYIYVDRLDFKKALFVLEKGLKRFNKVSTEYLEALADIAWGLGLKDKGFKFSKELIRSGKGRLEDYIRIVEYYREKGDLNKAVEYIKKAYEKYKNVYVLKLFIDIKFKQQKWNEIISFLNSVDRYTKEKLLDDSYITYIYATALENTGRYEEMLNIYVKSLNISFSISKLNSILLLLIDMQRNTLLKQYLDKYYSVAKKHKELWLSYALGYLSIQDTERARYFINKVTKEKHDINTQLIYADLLEVSGEDERAKHIRFKIWQKIKNKKPSSQDQLENYLRLASYFMPVKSYKRLLEKYKNNLDPETFWDLKYSFLIKVNAQDKVKYLSQKYNYLKVWMKMNLALVEDDRYLQSYLLERYPDLIPIRDRVDAAVRTGQIGLAKQLAFSGLEKNQNDYLLYYWLRDLYMNYSGKLELKTNYEFRRSVNRANINFNYRYPLQNRSYLIFDYSFISQKSSDRNYYINIPSTENTVSLKLKYLLERGYVQYEIGYRNALSSFLFANLSLNFYLKDKTRVIFNMSVNGVADDTMYTLIGGKKTGISISGIHSLNNRTFVNLTFSGRSIRSQDGTKIGNGYTGYMEVYYKLRVSYPDFSFRSYISSNIYSERTGYKGNIQSLSPVLTVNFLPENFVETGGEFSFGYDNRFLYTRTVRPFMKVGFLYNTITEFGYFGEIGVGGVLTKSDNLNIGIGVFRGFTGFLDQFINIFVEYRKWF